VARALVLKERHRDYVLAARCTGAGSARVMFLHVLPNAVSPMIVNLALIMGFSVLAEASLGVSGSGHSATVTIVGGDAQRESRVPAQ